ncbi:hypothetical protein ACFP1I_12750 [Dyadobacter subterraneus]|uniref:Uncharacterized protein n=1 Tax=Dyadobacter subterraneus TaxID=2773304 RepID=A0ABR9WAD8_9BACT|nr:hypothetical protein [Dyadobacter subterraneus]MBE9462099.1 hypothetical protein [Dyadobacter subterraneus]
MKRADSQNQQPSDWEFNQLIETMLQDIYLSMPSTGVYPFTVIRTIGTALISGVVEPMPMLRSQILVLRRTDFDYSDFTDYVINSKEYNRILSENREAFLEAYRLKYPDFTALAAWTEQITAFGIGILGQLAGQKNVKLTLIETDLDQWDTHYGLTYRNLQAYQVFEAKPIL